MEKRGPTSYRYAVKTACGFAFAALLVFELVTVSRHYVECKVTDVLPMHGASLAGTSQSATSGSLFKGERLRTYDGPLYFTKEEDLNRNEDRLVEAWKDVAQAGPPCERWGVVTTIFEPSDAVRSFAGLKDQGWCLVVVGDKKGPAAYDIAGADPNRLVFLDRGAQEALAKDCTFIGQLPWNHFGRKNVGFLYAIARGAKTIWDFDDDNVLLPNAQLPDLVGGNAVLSVMVPANHAHAVYNPYPKMGAPSMPSWPRGQPLDTIKNDATYSAELVPQQLPAAQIGAIQSLAQNDPDMDAIYRLTQPIPFEFTAPAGLLVRIPNGVRAPFNAQACLWNHDALWGMLLPITVHGRVSDIWRSYMTQTLMERVGQALVFSAPLVAQYRNAHNYLADFNAEQHLYMRSGALVEFLRSWVGQATTLPGLMEELAVAVYERGYLELHDVWLVQEWIRTLLALGYKFPALLDHPR